MVFRKLAGCTERTLKKLKRGGKERKGEEEERRRGGDKETKRLREEGRGRERKGEEERRRQKTKGERRKSRLFETLMFMNFSRIDHKLIFGT